MAEKKGWGLGAKLKNLFGGSKEAPVDDAVPPTVEQATEPATTAEKPSTSEKKSKPATEKSTPAKEKSTPAPVSRRGPFVLSEETWDELEEMLLGADFGPDITDDVVEALRSGVAKVPPTDAADVTRMLREILEERLSRFDSTLTLQARPAVVLVVGVNGVGKTTTIGKFARFVRNAGRSVVVGAADTFRAAAVDQLATWAERADVELVRPQQEGQDPSSVAYQTVERALAGSIDVAIIDTAGRLQTKSGLMDELSKIRRVIEKQAPIAEVLLVLDATTGQNGLAQAEAFLEHAGVTGLVLTKLDGSAKGGFVLAVQEKTGIPVKLIGSGEGIGDLQGFSPVAFAAALVE